MVRLSHEDKGSSGRFVVYDDDVFAGEMTYILLYGNAPDTSVFVIIIAYNDGASVRVRSIAKNITLYSIIRTFVIKKQCPTTSYKSIICIATSPGTCNSRYFRSENAKAYLQTELFKNDVVRELSPLFDKTPEIKIYCVAG